MKRTAEKVLGIIGLVLFFIGAALIALLAGAMGNENFQQTFVEVIEQAEGFEDPETGEVYNSEEIANEVEAGFDEMGSGLGLSLGLYAGIGALVAIAGIVAVVLVKKKPIAAGVIFLVSAVVAGFFFAIMIFPLVPIILYIIAGIMALVRKPPREQIA
ncbi:DUF4064 domain-containing protein [Shouchella shacheensis]|uniref:DUF4064 domain-containing protein n=1 Tax=Shouchella shacheensis TaxID=1649580 RepID=UPI00073FBDAE|nr:DUF4064 domain-containing protein [Shouchella shacheensis]